MWREAAQGADDAHQEVAEAVAELLDVREDPRTARMMLRAAELVHSVRDTFAGCILSCGH